MLRQDNADLRLTKKGFEIGLISKERYDALCQKEQMINQEVERLHQVKVGANKRVQEFLKEHNSAELKTAASLAELIRRPEFDYDSLEILDEDRISLPKDVIEQVTINIKYEGYIERQKRQVHQFKKIENRKIPADLDYDDVKSLRIEATQKLKQMRPETIGMASRIQGVSPADISVLMVYLEQYNRHK